MRKKITKKVKLCPLLNQNCLKKGCEIYNEMLDRCDISLVAYNLYLLTITMKEKLEFDRETDE